MHRTPSSPAEWSPQDASHSRSEKTPVFEFLYFFALDADLRTWKRRRTQQGDIEPLLVTKTEVQQALIFCAERGFIELSRENPANFFKDFVRRTASARANWPTCLREARVTAEQRTGEGDCFSFRLLMPAEELFPNELFPSQELIDAAQPLESLSLPLASRQLGRRDESWLCQAVVRLKVIEHYLAATFPTAIQLDHLQMSVKLRRSEIDALFLLTCSHDSRASDPTQYLVTLEAKQGDDILLSQIAAQVKNAAHLTRSQTPILPMAVKALRQSRLYVVHFGPVDPAHFAGTADLVKGDERVFRLVPQVPGI